MRPFRFYCSGGLAKGGQSAYFSDLLTARWARQGSPEGCTSRVYSPAGSAKGRQKDALSAPLLFCLPGPPRAAKWASFSGLLPRQVHGRPRLTTAGFGRPRPTTSGHGPASADHGRLRPITVSHGQPRPATANHGYVYGAHRGPQAFRPPKAANMIR